MKTSLILGICVALGIPAWASVTLPKFITDNMVVQQNSRLTIPGTAKPGAEVTASADWSNGVKASAKAGADGRFSVALPTPAAGGPYTIVVSDGDGDPVVLSNVLSGEVWLCSGQSNMEFPVKGWGQVMNSDEVVATANHPAIRLLQVRKNLAYSPQDDAEVNMGGWVTASPATMDFSAVAYLFALQMQKELGVPVGVIDSSWGGTPAETWVSYDRLQGIPGFEYALDALKSGGFTAEGVSGNYETEMKRWKEQLFAGDLKFDIAAMQKGDGWGTMPVPGQWEKSVLPGFDGTVWVQRELDLPASATGKPLQLKLGAIDNMDDTYFNGKRVGGMDDWTAARSYEVPGNLVKAGRNVITVRIVDFDGEGGIAGNASDVAATVDGKTYPLAGDWNYRVVCDIKKLSPRPVNPATSQYPTLLYNAMIHPLRVMPVKGVLWYQGCANVGRAEQYEPLLQALINNWRELYDNPQMPFYFVQLAGWLQPRNVQPDSEWAALRNAQAKALKLPETGMAVAIDLGNPADIHPVDKQEVARRLSLLALNRTYGKADVVCEAPRCVSSKSEGGKMVLKFNAPVNGDNGVLTGFIVGDKEGKFAYAKAERKCADTIVLSSPVVKNPVCARYDWADYPQGNIRGESGLPVAPFATDK